MEEKGKKNIIILPITLFGIGIILIGIAFSGVFKNKKSDNSSYKNENVIEDVTFSSSVCSVTCITSFTDSKNITREFVDEISNEENNFMKINNYHDYVKMNIYYNKKGNSNILTNYKIFLRSTNEDISYIKTEKELREKLGLYSLGEHTDTLTLKKIGETGFGYNDDISYVFKDYLFVDSNNNEYNMRYKNDFNKVNFIEGNKYNITFEVTEGDFYYEFEIKSVN